MLQGLGLISCATCLVAMPVLAQQSGITPDRAQVQIMMNGALVTIDRNGPLCPPQCIQPMVAAPGIAPIGELEVLDFLDLFVSAGTGLLVDVRLPQGQAAGTLPGAVSVPSATLAADNPYRDDLLTALGVQNGDFSGAFDLVIFASGPDAPDAPEALRHLLAAGYPAEKLKYYRGGFASWTALGLSTATGG